MIKSGHENMGDDMKTKKKHDTAIQKSWMLSSLERIHEQSADAPLFVEIGNEIITKNRHDFYENVIEMARFLDSRKLTRGMRLILDIDVGTRWEVFVTWCACQALAAQAFFWPPDMRFRHAAQEVIQCDEINAAPAPVLTASIERIQKWLTEDEKKHISGRLFLLIRRDLSTDPEIETLKIHPVAPQIIPVDQIFGHGDTSPANFLLVNDEAAIVYTQGSHQTARPVVLSFAHMHAQAEDLLHTFSLDENDRIFCDLTSVHTVTLTLFAACLHAGSVLVTQNDSSHLANILSEAHITHAFMLPHSLKMLAAQVRRPSNATKGGLKWRNLCLNLGKFKIRNPQIKSRLVSPVIDSVCINPIKNRIFPNIKAIISYGNHFDSKSAEIYSFLSIPTYNAYTVTEIGFVHIHEFSGSGGFLKSIDAKIKNGILSVKSSKAGNALIPMNDIVFEDERCGLCTHRTMSVTLENGTTVDASPMLEILRRDRMIDEMFILGNGRPFLTALVYLNDRVLKEFAVGHKLPEASFSSLAQYPEVYRYIRSLIDDCNLRRSPQEAIQKIAILPRIIDEDPRILTPCRLTRRTDVEHRYASLIESFYTENF